MKAKNKYGSAYPATTPVKKIGLPLGRKVAPLAEGQPAAGATDLTLPHERDEAIDRKVAALPGTRVSQACRDDDRKQPGTDHGVKMQGTDPRQNQ